MSESKSLKECLESYANATFAQTPAGGTLEFEEDFGKMTIRFMAEDNSTASKHENTKLEVLKSRLAGYQIPFEQETNKLVKPTLTIDTFSTKTVDALKALGTMASMMRHRNNDSTTVELPVLEQKKIKGHAGKGPDDTDFVDGVDIR